MFSMSCDNFTVITSWYIFAHSKLCAE